MSTSSGWSASLSSFLSFVLDWATEVFRWVGILETVDGVLVIRGYHYFRSTFRSLGLNSKTLARISSVYKGRILMLIFLFPHAQIKRIYNDIDICYGIEESLRVLYYSWTQKFS